MKPVRIPFFGAPIVIPGTIEAEDFDDGGEGLSYHDADELNIPGDYRPDESVDIYDRLGTGFHIGNAIAGEWYEYSVDIQKEGMYEVTAHIATGYNGGQFQISIDTIHSEIVNVTSTHSNLKTEPFAIEMYLYPGTKIMRFSVISNPTFNIDKITFDLKNATSSIDLEVEKPFEIFQNNTGEIVVKQNSVNNNTKIELYSLIGNLLKVVNNPSQRESIQTNDLPSGIYIVRVSNSAESFSKKVVIKQLLKHL